jgi:hypothetical protein
MLVNDGAAGLADGVADEKDFHEYAASLWTG